MFQHTLDSREIHVYPHTHTQFHEMTSVFVNYDRIGSYKLTPSSGTKLQRSKGEEYENITLLLYVFLLYVNRGYIYVHQSD